jgi:hypothetical protein
MEAVSSSSISIDPASDRGTYSDDGVTSNARPTLTGMVDWMVGEGVRVAITLASVSGAVVSGPIEIEPDSDGFWAYTPEKDLADGEYSATLALTVNGFLSYETSQMFVIDTAAPLIVRQPDLVQTEGAAFIVVPNYGKFEPTDDVRFEDVGGRLAKMGFAFSSDTGTLLAPKGWTLSEDSPGFGSVRVTATDLAGNAAVDEFQIAGVRKTNNLTSSAATIDESAAFSPKLYFDADGNGAGESEAFVQVELTGTAVPAFGDFLVVSGTVP